MLLLLLLLLLLLYMRCLDKRSCYKYLFVFRVTNCRVGESFEFSVKIQQAIFVRRKIVLLGSTLTCEFCTTKSDPPPPRDQILRA